MADIDVHAALERECQVLAVLAGLPAPIRVAFSGGVDSTYLLDLAFEARSSVVLAVTADSPSLSRDALAEAVAFCVQRGIPHQVVASTEFANPDYLANDGQRCYHCKSALMEAMALTGEGHPTGCMIIGAIADDLADFRPGMRAAQERGARFPLAEVGMTKAEIRLRSRSRGLPTWDRPAEPCLSSRIPYGEPVEPAALRLVEQAEWALRYLGFATVRARTHAIGGRSGIQRGWLCRLEVADGDIQRVVECRADIDAALRHIGYHAISVDLRGFTSGGLNELLSQAERAGHEPNLDPSRSAP